MNFPWVVALGDRNAPDSLAGRLSSIAHNSRSCIQAVDTSIFFLENGWGDLNDGFLFWQYWGDCQEARLSFKSRGSQDSLVFDIHLYCYTIWFSSQPLSIMKTLKLTDANERFNPHFNPPSNSTSIQFVARLCCQPHDTQSSQLSF